MAELPFKKGTKLYQTFQILADGNWHCPRHELPGTQPAKAIQVIRQNGYEIENKTISCGACKENTVHRRLVSITPSAPSVVRSVLPESSNSQYGANLKDLAVLPFLSHFSSP